MPSSNSDDEAIMASATCKYLQKLVLQQLFGIQRNILLVAT